MNESSFQEPQPEDGENTAKPDNCEPEKPMPEEDDTQPQKSSAAKMEIFDWLQCVVLAIVIVIFFFVFFARTIGVDGISMLNTLHDKDMVIMSNLFYTPKNGDVIVFQSESEAFEAPLVKRVIALEDQVVDIDFTTGDVFVDGVIINEPYIYDTTFSRYQFSGPVTVEKGHVFVMGDNRNNSTDSRASAVRQVDTRLILGRVLFLVVPGGDEDGSRDWSRIGPVSK